MTDNEIIQALRENCEGDTAVDTACIERLRRALYRYGKEGEISRRLMDIVSEILEL